jgi:hypothetical protein
MEIEEAIYSILSNDSYIAGIVGTRIYPTDVPQDQTLPYISYEISAKERFSTFGGDLDTIRSTVEIQGFSEKIDSLHDLAIYIKSALNRYRATIGTIEIKDTYFTGEFIGYESEIEAFRGTWNFQCWHSGG